MKNYSHSLWVSIYELFNEFFGGLLPGAFFCTYFILCATLLTSSLSENNWGHWGIAAIATVAISYAMGAIFRASNMREPDIESARHIYFHSVPTDDNAFAFVDTMSNEDYKQLIENLESDQILNLDYSKLKNRWRKPKRNMKNLKAKSIPYCLRKIYKKAIRQKKKLEREYKFKCRTYTERTENAQKTEAINLLIETLLPHLSFSVDYPYYNLKKYFSDRKMNSIADMVEWQYSTIDNKITARSKSLICDIKLKLRNNPNVDISLVTKSEAHIRFMNAMWYAAKNLRRISAFISVISFLILSARAGIYFLAGEYSDPHTTLTADFSALAFNPDLTKSKAFPFLKAIQMFLYYIQLIIDSKNLFLIFLISIIYFWLCYIIICAIKNNFHYQRIREITYLFQTYQIMNNLTAPESQESIEINSEDNSI